MFMLLRYHFKLIWKGNEIICRHKSFIIRNSVLKLKILISASSFSFMALNFQMVISFYQNKSTNDNIINNNEIHQFW